MVKRTAHHHITVIADAPYQLLAIQVMLLVTSWLSLALLGGAVDGLPGD